LEPITDKSSTVHWTPEPPSNTYCGLRAGASSIGITGFFFSQKINTDHAAIVYELLQWVLQEAMFDMCPEGWNEMYF